MSDNPLNSKENGHGYSATNIRPADFSLGSPQSRAAARALLQARIHKTPAEREHDALNELCKKWIVSHKAGPMFWLRGPRDEQGNLPAKDPNLWLTATVNYQWKEQGLLPVMPFPYKPFPKGTPIDFAAFPFEHDFTPDDPPDYLDLVMGYLLATKDLNIPKTRELMTSWLVVSFITWFCQFYETIGCIGQSEDDLKAQGLIKYSNVLYGNQPIWLKAMHPLKRGTDAGTAHKIEWANGSYFIGLPSGVRKSASQHVEIYFSDESAHIAGWSETVNIVAPMAERIICVSSIAPGDFADACQLDGVSSATEAGGAVRRSRRDEGTPYIGQASSIAWETSQDAGHKSDGSGSEKGVRGSRHMTADGRPEVYRD